MGYIDRGDDGPVPYLGFPTISSGTARVGYIIAMAGRPRLRSAMTNMIASSNDMRRAESELPYFLGRWFWLSSRCQVC